MSFADQYVARFEPWLTPDLETYLRAICEMFSEVELLAFDTETDDGWTILFDPARAPADALPYLAQFVGERLPVGISEGAAREWISDAPNQHRGTPYSIFRAAQRKLTGLRTVQIRERAGVGGADDPERLIVNTYSSETPDESGTLADIMDVVPADVVLVYSSLDGQTWDDVDTAYASWAAVDAANDSWEEVRQTAPPGDVFTRPASW